MNDKSQKKLSIITVAYKSNALIQKCIRSLEKYNDISDGIEVIVVDNYPFGEDSFSRISSQFPHVTVINNPSNGGFGQGNNIGVNRSSGDYLLFLNPDTELIEPIFKFSIDKFDFDPKLAAFGMTLCDHERRTDQKSYGLLPENSGVVRQLLSNFLIKYLNFTPKSIYPWGADLFIRRNIFLEIGGFDENYFLCYEEPDLIRRIPSFFKVRIYQNKIMHSGGHSLKLEEASKTLNWYLNSEQYYFKKYNLDYRKYIRPKLIKLRLNIFLKLFLGIKVNRQHNLLLEYYRKIVD